MFRICNQTNMRGAVNHSGSAGTSYLQAVISQHILQEKNEVSHMELRQIFLIC